MIRLTVAQALRFYSQQDAGACAYLQNRRTENSLSADSYFSDADIAHAKMLVRSAHKLAIIAGRNHATPIYR